MMINMNIGFSVLFVLGLICLTLFSTANAVAAPVDNIPPKIDHKPMKARITAQQPVTLEAVVRDNVGIKSVTLFYRTSESPQYVAQAMDAKEKNRFVSTVPVSLTNSQFVDYYFEAVDVNGNMIRRGGRQFAFRLHVEEVKGENNNISETGLASKSPASTAKKKTRLWPWVVGALAVGTLAALASGGGGGGGGGSSGSGTAAQPTMGTVTLEGIPLPSAP